MASDAVEVQIRWKHRQWLYIGCILSGLIDLFGTRAGLWWGDYIIEHGGCEFRIGEGAWKPINHE